MKKILTVVIVILIFITSIVFGNYVIKRITEKDNEVEIEKLENENETEEQSTNIIKRGEVTTSGLYESLNGEDDIADLMTTDMLWSTEHGLYYKIITNYEEYNKYNKRKIGLPEMVEEDFENNSLIIVANERIRESYEKDLIIYDVTNDENITNIILMQRENPHINSDNNVFWAVVNKALIKDCIVVKIEQR